MQPNPRNDVVWVKLLGFLLVVSLDVGKRKKEDMADLQTRLGLGIRGSSAVEMGGRFR